MSDFIDFNWDGGAMPGLETNDEPFDFSFLDDPAHSGPQFPFDELAVPVAHHASLRTPFVVNDLLVEVVGEPDGNEHQAPSLNEAMSTTAQPSPLPPPRDTGVSDLLRSNTSSGSSSETEFNALETEPQTNEHALVGNKLQSGMGIGPTSAPVASSTQDLMLFLDT
ncbi:Fc.00g031050.m01.CDS01 [Cosmosporella sp. VM-42]